MKIHHITAGVLSAAIFAACASKPEAPHHTKNVASARPPGAATQTATAPADTEPDEVLAGAAPDYARGRSRPQPVALGPGSALPPVGAAPEYARSRSRPQPEAPSSSGGGWLSGKVKSYRGPAAGADAASPAPVSDTPPKP